MNEIVRNYITAFGASSIVFLLSLLIPELSTLYMGLYFVAGFLFIFTFNQPVDDPEHSTDTHFDYASRFNSYSYILSASLIVAAVIISSSQVRPNISTFVIWGISAAGVYFLTKFYSSRLFVKLVGDYLAIQLELPHNLTEQIVLILQSEPDTSTSTLVKKFDLPPNQATRLLYLYKQYVTRNLLAGPDLDFVDEN